MEFLLWTAYPKAAAPLAPKARVNPSQVVKTNRAARLCDPAHGAIIEPPLLVPGARREEQEEYLKELEKQKLYEPVAIFSRGQKEFIIKPDYLYRHWWMPDLSKPDDGEIVNLKP
jgi:hypothetical protein